MISQTVVVNGVSKAYAMTGWRLGYAAGPANLIAAAGRVQEHATSCVNSITQKACVTALNDEDDSIENMRQQFEQRRNFLYSEMVKNQHLTCSKPEGAFYLFPNISWYLKHNKADIKTTDQFCDALLEKHFVAVVSGSSFGSEGYVRFSYANSMDNLVKGAARFAEFLKDIRAS